MKETKTIIDFTTLKGQMIGRAAVTEQYMERMEELKTQIEAFCALVDNAACDTNRTRGELLAAMQEMSYHIDHAANMAKTYKKITTQQLLLSKADITDYSFAQAFGEQLPEACRKALQLLGDNYLQTEYSHLSLKELSQRLEQAKSNIEEALPIQIRLFQKLQEGLLEEHTSMGSQTVEKLFDEQFSRYEADNKKAIDEYIKNIKLPELAQSQLDRVFANNEAVNIWILKLSPTGLIEDMRANTGLEEGHSFVEQDLLPVFEYKAKCGILTIMINNNKAKEMKYNNCNIGQVVENGGNATMNVHMDDKAKANVKSFKMSEQQMEAIKRALNNGCISDNGDGTYSSDLEDASLAYFCGRIFCGDYCVAEAGKLVWKKGTTNFPNAILSPLFGKKNLGNSRSTRLNCPVPKDYQLINEIVDES